MGTGDRNIEGDGRFDVDYSLLASLVGVDFDIWEDQLRCSKSYDLGVGI